MEAGPAASRRLVEGCCAGSVEFRDGTHFHATFPGNKLRHIPIGHFRVPYGTRFATYQSVVFMFRTEHGLGRARPYHRF